MRPRTLAEVARVLGGEVLGDGAARIDAASADSREVRPGTLFFALRGERVDGHDFVAGALAAGASAAVVSRAGAWDGPVVRVPDTRAGLMALAADERAALDVPVVGITGSTGKTCVKDFTAAVLAARYRVHASRRSFNTEVGMPITILEAPPGTEALVLEMGSRGVGHVALLCDLAKPNVGIVTTVGIAHLELFGSRENVVRAKAELVEALPPDGVAVLNADDEVVAGYRERTDARVLTFGRAEDARVRALDVALDDDARASFVLRHDGAEERVELSVSGEHMVSNALAAAAAGIALGLGVAECASALKGATVSDWRMDVISAPGGYRVVNDAYNANPTSMLAALRALAWMGRNGRSIAVLGEMAELGDAAPEEHERVGEALARLGIDRVVAVGRWGRAIGRGAVREGVEPEHVTERDDAQGALEAVRELVRPGDVVLVKASRVVGLERVAHALAGERP